MTNPARVVNLTPHDPIVLHLTNGTTVTLPAAHTPILLREEPLAIGMVTLDQGVLPLIEQRYVADGVDLPAPSPGVWLLVSQLVAQAFPNRQDLAFPAKLVRDESGAIVGCAALARPGTGNTARR